MKTRSLVLVPLAALTLVFAADCRREPATPRSLMALDDEPRSAPDIAGKRLALPEEPRPTEWGGAGAPAGMQLDASPAGAQPAAGKPIPMPAEPRTSPAAAQK